MILNRIGISTTAAALVLCGLASSQSASAEQSQASAITQPFVTPLGTAVPAAGQHVSAQLDVNKDSIASSAEGISLVADTIYSLGRGAGFAGQVLDPDSGTISLHWKGDLPDVVTEYLRNVSHLGVKVAISNDASYTREEEQEAAERVANSEVAKTTGIASVAADSDGSGITVQFVGNVPDAKAQVAVVEAASMPVKHVSFEENVGEMVQLATRANDTSPWKGGIRTIHGTQGCSTGFAALSGSSGRLLSANHCDPSKSAKDGSGTTIAPASAVSGKSSIDSMSIDPTASPGTTPKIYTGAWKSSTTKTVKNWASNWTGDSICAGGASTGSHCGTITNDAVAVPDLTGSWYIRARASSGALAGDGDSGGPVYRTVTGGVQARGIIQSGYNATTTTCGTHNSDMNIDCYRDILYVPISVVLNAWNYSLEVG